MSDGDRSVHALDWYCRRSGERGAAALLMVVSVLVLMTVLTITSAEIATLEQRTAANELRSRQAFEAAMTGFEHALAHMAENPASAYDNAVLNAGPGNRRTAPGGGTYAVEFCDSAIDEATGLLQHPLDQDPIAPCTPGPAGEQRRLIYARGWSDDGTGLHHVTALVENAPAFAGAPANPVTARGTAVINGSGDVTNPEGRLTIWAGQTVSFTNANFKTNVLSPTGQGEVVESSSNRQAGMDVVANDGNLSNATRDQFFTNFMGFAPSAYVAAVGPKVSTDGNVSSLAGEPSHNGVIWAKPPAGSGTPYTFSTSGNPEFGSFGDAANGVPPAPAVVVIDGNFDVAGGVIVNGLLYVRGDITGHGNLTVRGSVIIEGKIENLTGSVDVIYSSLLLAQARGLGRGSYLPGSWKDWIQPIGRPTATGGAGAI